MAHVHSKGLNPRRATENAFKTIVEFVEEPYKGGEPSPMKEPLGGTATWGVQGGEQWRAMRDQTNPKPVSPSGSGQLASVADSAVGRLVNRAFGAQRTDYLPRSRNGYPRKECPLTGTPKRWSFTVY